MHLLNKDDFVPRLVFSRWYLEMRSRNPRFLDTVLFTDEATFTREGMFNSRNSHVWSTGNPHATRTRAGQVRFSVNVWAPIIGYHLIGPYLLRKRLTGQNYLIFLQQVLPQLLDDAQIFTAMRSSMWFQHDGAFANFSEDVRLHLYATYGQQ